MKRSGLSRPLAEALVKVCMKQLDLTDLKNRMLVEAAEAELGWIEKPETVDQDFETFWKWVPVERRVGKKESRELWQKAAILPDWPGAERVIEVWDRQVQHAHSLHSTMYGDVTWTKRVPHPATWLRQRRYLDL